MTLLPGSQLKEANCYRREQRKRMWCYPFIEEGLDNFATIDGTVQYSVEPNVIKNILQVCWFAIHHVPCGQDSDLLI